MITINKCYDVLDLINSHFNGLNKFSFISIYKTLVRSKLEYACSVWTPWQIGLVEKIEGVQKKQPNC